MEVHHHSHRGKKWHEYLTEFFMIFLAISLGFMAESYLAYSKERQLEHEFLVALVVDLKTDTANINHSFEQSRALEENTNTLTQLVYADLSNLPAQIKLYECSKSMMAKTFDVPFAQGTMNQLKHDGGLSLIRNRDILHAIKEYDNHTEIIKHQFEGVSQRYTELIAAEKTLFFHKAWIQKSNSRQLDIDTTFIRQTFDVWGTALVTPQPEALIQLDNTANLYYSYVSFYNDLCKRQVDRAIQLMTLIKNDLEE